MPQQLLHLQRKVILFKNNQPTYLPVDTASKLSVDTEHEILSVRDSMDDQIREAVPPSNPLSKAALDLHTTEVRKAEKQRLTKMETTLSFIKVIVPCTDK